MAQNYTLRGNHRDTFRLVPVGSTDPGDYIHVPTNFSGYANFEATPQNYYVYCRPAYTGEFLLLASSVSTSLQYLRTLNPALTADGIYELSAATLYLNVNFQSEFENLPYVKNNEEIQITVTVTYGGAPAYALTSPPVVNLYKPGAPTVVEATATYDAASYNSSTPHIYHYTYEFTTAIAEDVYYFKAYASQENLSSPDYPDDATVLTFSADYTSPTLTGTNVFLSSASSSLGAAGSTSTASVFVSIPENAISDTKSGPGHLYLQPFLENNPLDEQGGTLNDGMRYVGTTGTCANGTDLTEYDCVTVNSSAWTADADPDYVFRDLYLSGHCTGADTTSTNESDCVNPSVNGGAGDWHEPWTPVSFSDLKVNLINNSSSNDLVTTIQNYNGNGLFRFKDPLIISNYTLGSLYNYKIFKHALDDSTIRAEWPIDFPISGNTIQNILLTQDLPSGFVVNLEGNRYGFLITAADNATNTIEDIDDMLSPTILFDTIVELAPLLSWQFTKGISANAELAFTNENNWYNSGYNSSDGTCTDGSGNDVTSTYSTENTCIGAGYTWYADDLVLQVTVTNATTGSQGALLTAQYSWDGITWLSLGNADLVPGTLSQFFFNDLRQGANQFFLRGLNEDGNVVGNVFSIEYKWDKNAPIWAGPGDLGTGTYGQSDWIPYATGGFNRAYIQWTDSPIDYGTDASHTSPGSYGIDDKSPSGIEHIKIYRSINDGLNATTWSTVIASPTTFDLVEVGSVLPGTTFFLDTQFYNVDYGNTTLPPFLYWGIPQDKAGNDLLGQCTGSGTGAAKPFVTNSACTAAGFIWNTTVPLLTTDDGVEVAPLVSADVSGALGVTQEIEGDSIKVHYDIAVPIEALSIHTGLLSDIRGLNKIEHSIGGAAGSFNNIWRVSSLGEDRIVMYTPLESATFAGYTITLLNQTPTDLDWTHFLPTPNATTSISLEDRLVQIRIAWCEDSSGNKVTANGNYTECIEHQDYEAWKTKLIGVHVTNFSTNGTDTTITIFESLDFATIVNGVPGVTDINGAISDSHIAVDFGYILDSSSSYTLNFTPIQTSYFWQTQFNEVIPSASCSNASYVDEPICVGNQHSWIDEIHQDSVHFDSILAADLIVGGTLRLETGLSVWSGGFVDGEPTGSGLTMDELGLRMFDGADTTVDMSATSGNFQFGKGLNKLTFDAATGELTLVGTLSQINSDSGITNPNFTGAWDQYGPGGSSGSPIDYTYGDLVFDTDGDYWAWGNHVDGNTTYSPVSDGVNWILYASSGITGSSAQDLFLTTESQVFVRASNSDVITSPEYIEVTSNAQNIEDPIRWIAEGTFFGTGSDISASINSITMTVESTVPYGKIQLNGAEEFPPGTYGAGATTNSNFDFSVYPAKGSCSDLLQTTYSSCIALGETWSISKTYDTIEFTGGNNLGSWSIVEVLSSTQAIVYSSSGSSPSADTHAGIFKAKIRPIALHTDIANTEYTPGVSVLPNSSIFLYSDIMQTGRGPGLPSNTVLGILEKALVRAEVVETNPSTNIETVQYFDAVTLHTLQEGSAAYGILLSNPAHIEYVNEFGTGGDWNDSVTSVSLFLGIEQRQAKCVVKAVTANWVGTAVANTNEPTDPSYDGIPLFRMNGETSLNNTGVLELTIYDVDFLIEQEADLTTYDYSVDPLNAVVFDTSFTVTKVLSGSSNKTLNLVPTAATYTVDPNTNEVLGPAIEGTKAIDIALLTSNLTVESLSFTLSGSDITTNPIETFDVNLSLGSISDYDGVFEVISNNPWTVRVFLDPTNGQSSTLQVSTSVNVSEDFPDGERTSQYTDTISLIQLLAAEDTITGVLSNETFNVSATYTGEIAGLGDAGGVYSVFRGTNLLNNGGEVTFSATGAWYGRCWHNSTIGMNELTLDYFATPPDQTKTVKWEDLGTTSRVTMGGSGSASTFFDNDPGDNFTSWVTTWIRIEEDVTVDNVSFRGDNEHRLYINNEVPLNTTGEPVEDAAHTATDNYTYAFTTTGGYDVPGGSGSGPWYKIDMLYHEGGGGDYVYLGWNPINYTEMGPGGGAVVGEINSTTGEYYILHFNEPWANSAKQFFLATVTNPTGVTAIEKEYTISKAVEGAPGTYAELRYFVGPYNTISALQTYLESDGAIMWPPNNPGADILDGWAPSIPGTNIPGFTTWITTKTYRVDGTTPDNSEWSTPVVFSNSPLDPTIYYIKPLNGTSLHNSVATDGSSYLNVQGIRQNQTDGELELPTDSTYILASDSGGSSEIGIDETFTASISSADITGSLTLYLIDTSVGTILDTLTLVDVSDGMAAGYVTADTLVFTQQTSGLWDPIVEIAVTATFILEDGSTVSTVGSIQADGGTGFLTLITAFDETEITVNSVGTNSHTLTLTFTHTTSGMQVSETFYAVSRGEQGDQGNQGLTGPSVVYTGGWDINRDKYFAMEASIADLGGGLTEIVRYDYTNPTASKEYHGQHGDYYICALTHTVGVGDTTPATSEGTTNLMWTDFGAQFETVATGLLLAETIIGNDIFGNTLSLTDSFTLSTPDGYCDVGSHLLINHDSTGNIADYLSDELSDEYIGHWQAATIEGRNFAAVLWDATDDGGGQGGMTPPGNNLYLNSNLTLAKCIALYKKDKDGTDNSALLDSLQVGSIIQLIPNAADTISVHGVEPFYFKVVDKGAYPSCALNPLASCNIYQIDVEYLSSGPNEELGNTNTSDINPNEGYEWALVLSSAYQMQGACEAIGGSWVSQSNKLAITASGLETYNQEGDRTVQINAADGSFTFGNETGQHLKYTAGGLLTIHGTLIVEGQALEQQIRTIDLYSTSSTFSFTQCVINWEGTLNLYQGGINSPSKTWSFQGDGGPVLIIVTLTDPESGYEIQLNGTSLGEPPHWNMYDNAEDDDDKLVPLDFEFYSNTSSIGENIVGLHNLKVDGVDLRGFKVYTQPSSTSITVYSNLTNLSACEAEAGCLTWAALKTGGIADAGEDQLITVVPSAQSATLSLENFMGNTANALLSSAVMVLKQAAPASGDYDIQDTYTVTRLLPGVPGEQSIVALLSNEAHSVAGLETGAVTFVADGYIQVFDGINDVTSVATFSHDTVVNGLGDMNTTANEVYTSEPAGYYRLTQVDAGANFATLPMTISYGGVTLTKTFSVSVSREGAVGDPAKIIKLSPTSQFFTVTEGNVDGTGGLGSPSSITINTTIQNIDSGLTWTVDPATTNTNSTTPTSAYLTIQYADFAGSPTLVTLEDANGVSDSVTLMKVGEGSSSITAFLTNESHTVSANPDGSTPDCSAASGEFVVMQGASDISAQMTFFGVTSGNVGCTFASNVYTCTCSGWADNSLTNAVTLTATLPDTGATTIDKVFTLTKSLEGVSGVSGQLAFAQSYDYDNIDISAGNATGPGSYKFGTTYSAGSSYLNDTISSDFSTAGALLLNKTDINSADHSNYLNTLEVDDLFAYYIEDNRWYTYKITNIDATPASADVYNFGIQFLNENILAGETSINNLIPVPVSFRFARPITGIDGLNTATVTLYKRAASAPPDTASITGTYIFSSGAFTGTLNSWSLSVPAVNGNPLWATMHFASADAATITLASWSNPVQINADGTTPTHSANLTLYKRNSSATTVPAVPNSSDLFYTFATGVIGVNTGGTFNNWALNPGTSGTVLWYTVAMATASADAATDTVLQWSTAGILAQDGQAGDTGGTGQAGLRGTEHVYIASTGGAASNWSPAACTAKFSTSTCISNDVCTSYNESATPAWSITYFYAGGVAAGVGTACATAASWTQAAQVIDGNLLVDGSITADAIAAETITATHIETDTITADQCNLQSLLADTAVIGNFTLSSDQLVGEDGKVIIDSGSNPYILIQDINN